MRWPPPRARIRLAAAFFGAAVVAIPASAAEKTVVVSPEIRVTIASGDEISLSARPLPGEGVDAFVKRLTEDPKTKKEILQGNGGLRRLRTDGFVRVPYRLLSPSFRKIASSTAKTSPISPSPSLAPRARTTASTTTTATRCTACAPPTGS